MHIFIHIDTHLNAFHNFAIMRDTYKYVPGYFGAERIIAFQPGTHYTIIIRVKKQMRNLRTCLVLSNTTLKQDLFIYLIVNVDSDLVFPIFRIKDLVVPKTIWNCFGHFKHPENHPNYLHTLMINFFIQLIILILCTFNRRVSGWPCCQLSGVYKC